MLDHWFLRTFPKYNYLHKDGSDSISTTDAAGSSLGFALVRRQVLLYLLPS